MKIDLSQLPLLLIILLIIGIGIYFLIPFNRVHFVVDHGLSETLSLQITIDGKTIFLNKNATPAERMPPIIYSKHLFLNNLKHKIEFIDNTRNVEETKYFKGNKVKTILIQTAEDDHITISEEKIRFK